MRDLYEGLSRQLPIILVMIKTEAN